MMVAGRSAQCATGRYLGDSSSICKRRCWLGANLEGTWCTSTKVVPRHRLYAESMDYFVRPREDLLMVMNALLGLSAPVTL